MSNAVYCTRCGGLLYGNSEMTSAPKCMCPPQVEFVQYGWVCPRCGTVHAPFVRECGCPAYTITTLSTMYGLGTVNINMQETPQLTPLHKCMELKGKYYSDNIVELYDCMSIRLINVCKTAKNTFDKYPVYYETITYKDTRKIRAFGKKTWDEFVELRSVFEVAREQNK